MICQGLRHDQILIAAAVNSKKLELIEMFWLQECRYRYNRPLNYIPLRVQNREITSGWQSARAWGRRSWQSTSTELLWLETSMMRLKFSQKNLYLTLNLSSRNFRISPLLKNATGYSGSSWRSKQQLYHQFLTNCIFAGVLRCMQWNWNLNTAGKFKKVSDVQWRWETLLRNSVYKWVSADVIQCTSRCQCLRNSVY